MIDCKGAPPVEGHKAIVSGLDMFTFGGHKLLGKFDGQDVAVHKCLGLLEVVKFENEVSCCGL